MKRLILLHLLSLSICAVASAQTWTIKSIADGAKPDIEVTPDGQLHFAYLFENSTNGSLSYASYDRSNDSLNEMQVLSNFLFGPADLEMASDGTPYISYVQIDGSNINAEVISRNSSGWTSRAADSPNSDGWDASMELVNDLPRLVFVDAQDHLIELATYSDSTVSIETVAQNDDIDIDLGTSIAANTSGDLFITYFDLTDSTLKLTQKVNGAWAVQNIATDGQAPNVEIASNGDIHVAYYARERDSLDNYLTNGHIVLASLANNTWSYDTVSTVSGLSVGRQDQGQEPLDLELDANDQPHIAYGTEAMVIYANHNGSMWNIATVADLSSSADEIGQQAALAIDANGMPHIAYFVRENNGDNTVFYANIQQEMPLMASITCPGDTTLPCGSTADMAGMAVADSGIMITFVDSIMQDCPQDQIIRRTWIASTARDADTCVQMITIMSGDFTQNALLQDTLRFSGMCPADLMAAMSDTLSLACGSVVDSITQMMAVNNCDTMALHRTWHITDACADTSITLTQYVVATDLPVLSVTDTMINFASGSQTNGSIAITLACGNDDISYAWSNGSTSAVLDSVDAGDYGVKITSDRGCSDSLSFSITEEPLSLICPPDTTLGCGSLIIPEFTGMATITGYDTLITEDEVRSTCPDDIVIARSWIALKDSTAADTCIQMIILEVDSLENFALSDTLTFDRICMDQLPTLLEQAVTLPCNVTADSISMRAVETTCDRHVMIADWDFSVDCADSIISSPQVIIINNPIVYAIDDTQVSYDTMANTASIRVNESCRDNSATLLWSNGSDSTLVDVAPGDYQVVATNDMGCRDTVSITIAPIAIDTTPTKEYSLSCPADTSVSCNVSMMPSNLGIASMTGYDTLFFIDMVSDSCPADQVITRHWIASDSSTTDTCTQTITISRDGLAQLSIADTMTIDNVCAEDISATLSGLGSSDIACGIVLDTMIIAQDTSNSMAYAVQYTYIDGCIDDTMQFSQYLVFTNIASVSVSDVTITPDTGNMSGAIIYDLRCAPDSINYLWSDGNMDMHRSGISGGDYRLIISDTTGSVLDSFFFTVETIQDTTMVMPMLTCVSDTTINCDSSTDPSVTGMATQTGYDTLYYTDAVMGDCPNDLVITRTWIASLDSIADTCVQIITVLRNGLDMTIINETQVIKERCVADVLADDGSSLALGCGVVLDSMSSEVTSQSCNQVIIERIIMLSDTCTMTSRIDTQMLILSDIPVAKIENENIRPDYFDSLGMISLDLVSCDDQNVNFSWSTGDTSLVLDSLAAGDYSIFLSNDSMCVDTVTFTVDLVDTTAIALFITDRRGSAFTPDSIRFRRSNGRKIDAELTKIRDGEYSFSSEQTFISGDQVCFNYTDDAAVGLSVLDIVKARRHILGLQLACDDDILAADVNFSNDVSSRDLADIQRIILNIDSIYDHGKTWIFTTETASPNANLRQAGCIEILRPELDVREIKVKAIKLGDLICEDDQ